MTSGTDPFDPAADGRERERLCAAAERLVDAGFASVGWWALGGNGREVKLRLQEAVAGRCPALYAFTVDGALAYIGKTVRPLRQRLQGYQWPSADPRSGASTNRENNARIVLALARGQQVRIWSFTGTKAQQHAGFELDLPAALEGALISSLAPPWNRQRQTGRSVDLTPRDTARNSIDPRADAHNQTGGTSMTPTAAVLLDFARSQQGAVLHTLKRNTPFRVEVNGNAFEFLPTSGQARREGLASADAVLKAFHAKPSWQMSDYQELTFNASYLLALLKGWQDCTEVRSR